MRLSTLISLLPAFHLAAAQWDRQPYCDMKKKPNMAGCFDIKDHGVSASDSYENDRWRSGNCEIGVSRRTGSINVVHGADLKWAIQTIIDTCDTGFMYIGGVRVEVGLCIIGQAGVQQECNSPLFKIEKRDGALTGQELARGTTSVHSRRSAIAAPVHQDDTPNPLRSHVLFL